MLSRQPVVADVPQSPTNRVIGVDGVHFYKSILRCGWNELRFCLNGRFQLLSGIDNNPLGLTTLYSTYPEPLTAFVDAIDIRQLNGPTTRMLSRTAWIAAIVFAMAHAATGVAVAQCRAESEQPITRVSLPGSAFHAIATRDGCWGFVSMGPGSDPTGAGVAVLKRNESGATLLRTVPGPRASGLALTHDEHILIVAATDRVGSKMASSLSFYDVGRLTSGASDFLLGVMQSEGDPPGYFHMLVTPNDHLLFVSNHNTEGITVLDLAEARRSGFRTFRIVGKIPTGYGPVSIAISSDQRWLYATTQSAHDNWHWPIACRGPSAPGTAALTQPRGAVHVIDAARAAVDPAHSVVATVAAGCNPARLVLSPKSDRAYVTARSDDTLLVFDTKKIVTDSSHALVASIKTHTGPIGLAVLDGGRRLAVANALRFSGKSPTSDSEVVMVVDTAAVARGQEAIIGSIPSGGGPVDLTLTPDGKTLLVPNNEPKALTFVQVRHLPSK